VVTLHRIRKLTPLRTSHMYMLTYNVYFRVPRFSDIWIKILTLKVLCKSNDHWHKDWAKKCLGTTSSTNIPFPPFLDSVIPLICYYCTLFIKLRACEHPHLVNLSFCYEYVWFYALSNTFVPSYAWLNCLHKQNVLVFNVNLIYNYWMFCFFM
jgi:hypothetical protein